MEKQLVTCPACRTDQHVYGGKVCNHTMDGGLRCPGSRSPLKAQKPVEPPSLNAFNMELLEALKAFQAAAHKLNTTWEKSTSGLPSEDETLEEAYPFKGSFDDVVAQIDTWVETHV